MMTDMFTSRENPQDREAQTNRSIRSGTSVNDPAASKPVVSAPPPKRYRIGEVVQYSGFSRQTIHNYTVMGLICESEWTQGGHRLYDVDVFERLAHIKAMKDHYRLNQIKHMLDKSLSGS